MPRSLITLVVILLPLRAVAADEPVAPAAAAQVAADQVAFFENHVRPIFVQHCLECHGPQIQESGLRLDSAAAVFRGGDNGPAVRPQDPDGSLLVQAIRRQGDLQMPPEQPLADHEIASIERWIANGAVWPANDMTATAAPSIRSGPVSRQEKQFWSFQPPADPVPPVLADDNWSRNAIDRFILDRLRQNRIPPAPPAERRELLRRLTFDLTGLPPTPDEMTAFLVDQSRDALDQVVERLLNSPAYGERWARHWLDVVRYADTAGETGDYPIPQAYLYRDYVIEAFQADKPYDQFIQEQIAGDLMAEDLLGNDHFAGDAAGEAVDLDERTLARYRELITATGFIAISRRFGFDPQNYHHLTIQDTIDTVGQAVLGLALGCARCHDHKFDAIDRDDYYAWYGIFASTKYAFPGSEQTKRPADFVPSLPAAIGEARKVAPDEGRQPLALLYGVVEGVPGDARIHLRGDPSRLGDEVPRRNLKLLGGERVAARETGSGRRQLARWLTEPSNPLTARVMVNRIWQNHFGQGIVATPNDFGVRGQRPSHPELLDWLTRRFMESGWSVKALQRLILDSQTYRLSSQHGDAIAETDPNNRLLSHFNRRRLSAEEIRDAMLYVGGNLDTSPMHEPHPFPPVESWGFTQHSPFYGLYPSRRRGIYLMSQRLKRNPFLALFDAADPNASTAHRITTTVPTQALFLMNSPFVQEQASGLASRLIRDHETTGSRITAAFEISLGRPPTPPETRETATFLADYATSLESTDVPADRCELVAWTGFARTLLTRNEFLFVD